MSYTKYGFNSLLVSDFTIERLIEDRDELGGRPYNFRVIGTTKGRLSTTGASDIEYLDGQRDKAEVQYVLFLPPDVDIRRTDRVRMTGFNKWLEVISINNPSHINHHLEVACKELQPVEEFVELITLMTDDSDINSFLLTDRNILSIVENSSILSADLELSTLEDLEVSLENDSTLIANILKEIGIDNAILQNTVITGVLSIVNLLDSNLLNISNITAAGIRKDISFFLLLDNESQVISNLNRVFSLNGISEEQSAIEADLTVGDSTLISFIEDISDITSNLKLDKTILFTLNENTVLISDLKTEKNIVVNIENITELTAVIHLTIEFIANITDNSNITGSIVKESSFDVTIGNQSNTIAELEKLRNLLLLFIEETNISVQLNRCLNIAGVIEEDSDIISSLNNIRKVDANVEENSNLTADIEYFARFISNIETNDNITGILSSDMILSSTFENNIDIIPQLKKQMLIISNIENDSDIVSMLIISRAESFVSMVMENTNIAAAISRIRGIDRNIENSSFIDSNLTVYDFLISNIEENSNIERIIKRLRPFKSDLQDESLFISTLKKIKNNLSTIEENSQLLSDITVISNLESRINNNSNIVTKLNYQRDRNTFCQYPIGDDITNYDWSARYDTDNNEFIITERLDANFQCGNTLHKISGSTGELGLVWDKHSGTTHTDIFTESIFTFSQLADNIAGTFFRMTNNSLANRTGYLTKLNFGTLPFTLELSRFNDGIFTLLDVSTGSKPTDPNAYYVLQSEVIGNNIRVRWWEYGMTPPANWQIDYIDDSQDAVNSGEELGIWCSINNIDVYWDAYTVEYL